MDGDGHSAKAFAWNEDADQDTAKPAKAFDPAAVLRAIDDEEDELSAPASGVKVDAEEAFGTALRAAMNYDEGYPAGEPSATEQEATGVPADEHAFDHQDDDHEDQLSLSDEHDEVEDWEEVDREDEDNLVHAPEDEAWPERDEPAEAGPANPASLSRAFPRIDDLDVPGRKPRIALMGEFSAGKSTLSNLLIGSAPLPMKVTATQLPPVWISWGDGEPYSEDLDGQTQAIDIARLFEIDPAETRFIRIFAKSEILELCDIIDMPGISDPNMASEVWERVIGKADGVIWCTHATQAWRQSEASVWESFDPKLFESSLLLVTRFDKLHSESDRTRVMRRVESETDGLFSARLPISLTEALAAGDDEHLLGRSGASAFRTELVEILSALARNLGSDPRETRTRDTLGRDGLVARMDEGRLARGITPSRILPRRVRTVSELAPESAERGGRDAGL